MNSVAHQSVTLNWVKKKIKKKEHYSDESEQNNWTGLWWLKY